LDGLSAFISSFGLDCGVLIAHRAIHENVGRTFPVELAVVNYASNPQTDLIAQDMKISMLEVHYWEGTTSGWEQILGGRWELRKGRLGSYSPSRMRLHLPLASPTFPQNQPSSHPLALWRRHFQNVIAKPDSNRHLDQVLYEIIIAVGRNTVRVALLLFIPG
jgi:hypothetical protein